MAHIDRSTATHSSADAIHDIGARARAIRSAASWLRVIYAHCHLSHWPSITFIDHSLFSSPNNNNAINELVL